MKFARDVLEGHPPTISPTASVADLAARLVGDRLEGICVVDGVGGLLGVVTQMDLIFREKNLHLPTTFAFMEGVLTFGLRRTRRELAKITGATVGAIMTAPPAVVREDTPLQEIASLMVERHYSIIPVVDAQGALVGVITRPGLLRAVFLDLPPEEEEEEEDEEEEDTESV